MNTQWLEHGRNGSNQRHAMLWVLFLGYASTLLYSVLRHELWGDELHSWNIAKASHGLGDLINNISYEGHPPVWYLLLYVLSKFTHDPHAMQYLHYGISLGILALIIFYSPFSPLQKLLIPAGYYFLFEYAVISRNYSIGILLTLFLCIILTANSKSKWWLYYIILFFLSNTHFLALIMALSFHVFVLYLQKTRGHRLGELSFHAFFGVLILFPACYFIYPPSSSALNADFWLRIWSKDQLFIMIQAPLKALVPIPAWWEYHFWNTQVLLVAQKTIYLLKYMNPLISGTLIVLVLKILYPSKKAVLFFLINLVLTLLFAFVFPLTTARYVGFIFVSFIVSLWLAGDEIQLNGSKKFVFLGLLVLQVIGGVVAISKDWSFKFSQANEISSLYKEFSKEVDVVTDYWCLNYLTAAVDKPIFCLGFNVQKEYIMWTREVAEMTLDKHLYCNGLRAYFQNKNVNAVYLFSTFNGKELDLRDQNLLHEYNIQLVTERCGSLEKNSNVYVYLITTKVPPD